MKSKILLFMLALSFFLVSGCVNNQFNTTNNTTQPNFNKNTSYHNYTANHTNMSQPGHHVNGSERPEEHWMNITIDGITSPMVYSTYCSGVNFSKTDNVDLIVGDNGFKFDHRIGYYCCADIVLNVSTKDHTINITEINKGEICRCMCQYTITGKVYNLTKGTYHILLYGIQFDNNYTHQKPEKKIDKYITIGGQSENKTETLECKTDSDCVHYPSCCHPGAQKCVSKNKVQNISLDCKNTYCTMNCMPCTVCRCQNGKCVTDVEMEAGCC